VTSPQASFDKRFSGPDAVPTPWSDVVQALEEAELYWISTVRADGRPHVTPLVGVVLDGVPHFCTGLEEQKARNIERNRSVALTTGTNAWARGLDVVVEGAAERVTDRSALQTAADAYDAKYNGDWHFEVGDGEFVHGDGGTAALFRIDRSKVIAFAKDPHGQTTFSFG
jgi:general stress protein 26